MTKLSKEFDMTNNKRCPDCEQIKSVDDFHNNKRSHDGKAAYCKVCLLARGLAYRLANPDKVKQTNQQSKKKNYAKGKETRRKYEDANRDLVNARKRDWARRNKQTVHQINQRSYAKNPELFIANAQRRYAKLKGVEQRLVTRKDYLRMQRMNCIYCQSKDRIEIDHVQPIQRNGRHSIGNLAAACLPCNRSKSDLFVMEWRIREMKKLGR
jgi:hypothetical protein